MLGSAGRGNLRKLHGGFQKVVQKGGVWEVSKGRGQAAVPPPHWLWDGLTSFAPEVRVAASSAGDSECLLPWQLSSPER
jgi:hypothetical protein